MGVIFCGFDLLVSTVYIWSVVVWLSVVQIWWRRGLTV